MVTLTSKTVTVAAAVEPAGRGVLALGTEIFNDYSGPDPFLNVIHNDEFRQFSGAGVGATIPYADLTDGWPTDVPVGADGVGLFFENTPPFKQTSYLVEWTSTADLDVIAAGSMSITAGPTYNAVTDRGSMTVSLTGQSGGFVFRRPTLDAGPINLSAMECIRDKTDPVSGQTYKQLYDSGKAWDPQYKALYAQFKPPVVRFLNQCDTNNNITAEAALSGWTTRASGPWARGNGGTNNRVPYDVMCELCNDLGADIWVTIPVNASDTFIQEVATEIKANLDSGLKAIFEIGNEVWNGIFDQTTFAVQQGCAWAHANRSIKTYTGASVSWGSADMVMASSADAAELNTNHALEPDETSIRVGDQYFKIASVAGATVTLDAAVSALNAAETTCEFMIVGTGEWSGVTCTESGGAGGNATIRFATTADATEAEASYNRGESARTYFVVGKAELHMSSRSGDTITLDAALNTENAAETTVYLGAAYQWYLADWYAMKAANMRAQIKAVWDSPRAITHYADKIGGISRRFDPPITQLLDATYTRPLDLHEWGGPALYFGANLDASYPTVLSTWKGGDQAGALTIMHDALMSDTPAGSFKSVPLRITDATNHLALWNANRGALGAKFVPYEGQEHWNETGDAEWENIILAYRADATRQAALRVKWEEFFKKAEGPAMALGVVGGVARGGLYQWFLVDNQDDGAMDAYGQEFLDFAINTARWW